MKHTQSHHILETAYEDDSLFSLYSSRLEHQLLLSTRKSIFVFTLISAANNNYKEILNYA